MDRSTYASIGHEGDSPFRVGFFPCCFVLLASASALHAIDATKRPRKKQVEGSEEDGPQRIARSTPYRPQIYYKLASSTPPPTLHIDGDILASSGLRPHYVYVGRGGWHDMAKWHPELPFQRIQHVRKCSVRPPLAPTACRTRRTLSRSNDTVRESGYKVTPGSDHTRTSRPYTCATHLSLQERY